MEILFCLHGLEEFIFIKMSILLKVIDLRQSLSKLYIFFANIEKTILKLMRNHKDPQIIKAVLRKKKKQKTKTNKPRNIILTDFKFC